MPKLFQKRDSDTAHEFLEEKVAPAIIEPGANGEVLKTVGGVPVWAAETAGGVSVYDHAHNICAGGVSGTNVSSKKVVRVLAGGGSCSGNNAHFTNFAPGIDGEIVHIFRTFSEGGLLRINHNDMYNYPYIPGGVARILVQSYDPSIMGVICRAATFVYSSGENAWVMLSRLQ